ncbi:MAG: Ig-like domain repeat protein, partial [Methanobrevibacter sp.]|nr:Ig-like domain repeat protein [Methanobrevibacter sp.]
PIETTVTVTVNEKPVTPKENLTISATADAITVGEDASIVVTGLENATGNVTVTAEEGIYTAPIVDGTATVIVPGLVKNITATVTYDGDDKYNNASTTVDIVVNPKSKENATYTIDAPEVTEGENATVTVTLPSDATGSVTIGEEIIPVQNGTASAVLSNLPVGNTTVPVTYSGDDKYNPIETTVTVTVNEKPVTPKENLTISATADAITVGEDAVIVVTGLENATGNVTVTAEEGIYTAPIVDGTATVIVPGLVKNITADVTYSGDDKYNNASTTVDIVVNPKEKENATVSIDAPEVTEGENATVTVTLPADATGSVTVGNETVPVVNGTATATVSDLPVGNTTLPITYSGDDKYNPIETTVTVTVEEKPVTPKENLTITASADPITVGEKATIVVSGLKDATGFVTAEVGDGMYKALIVKGSATINVPGLIENTTATISYPGDDKYNNASTTVDIVVNSKSKENATYSIDAPAVSEGENATVTVTLPSDATGTVTVGDEIIPVVNGTASAVLTNLPCGNTTVPVTYSGDNKYNPIETTVTVSVKEDTSDIISAPDVTKYYKGSERFVVTVTDYEGNPLANKTVIININGKDYTRTTDENGTASMALGLPSNTYNVTITVDNQIVNSVVTVLSTVDGTDVVKVYRNGTQYYATFTDSEGKYLASGTIVKFNINGVMYERKVSGDKGQAKLNINLPQGKYIITAINPSNGEMAANNITVLSTIAENKDIVKYYKNATQYTVKILGDDGKAVGAGVDVKFNINGIFYTRQTDASGIAKLSINLPPGDYVITAEYNGCKVANNITVLPVLSAKDITMKYRDGTKFTATLVDGQGKPYAEQKVQFNINGVLYNKETDSKGQAKLNINLLAGEYIITSSYNGANIANKITITA